MSLAGTTSVQSNGLSSRCSSVAAQQKLSFKDLQTHRCSPTPVLSTEEGSGCSLPTEAMSRQTTNIERWLRGHQIGRGSFGRVYKGLDLETGLIFAAKEADLGGCSDKNGKLLEQMRKELNIFRTLKHKNIVSYLGHLCSEGFFYIFLELVPGGSMATVLQEFGALKEGPLQLATQGALEGLAYLHTRSPPVVHRDMKGANLLVDLDFCVKLADFGCSKCHVNTKSFTMVGSIPWMAPEVVMQETGHGRKADIWSLGCLVLEMATARKPWGEIFDNVIFALKHIGMSDALPDIPDDLPGDCGDFVERCVRRPPSERWSSVQLLRHRYIQSNSTSDGEFRLFSRPQASHGKNAMMLAAR